MFLIGGEPALGAGSNSSALLPTVTTDSTCLRFVFRPSDLVDSLNTVVKYDADLMVPRTVAEGGVVINETNDSLATGLEGVEVLIPRSLEASGKLFARLAVMADAAFRHVLPGQGELF